MTRRMERMLGAGVVLILVSCAGFVWHLPAGLTVNYAGSGGDPLPESELSRRIQLPSGFSINTFASAIDGARMLRFTPAGDLLVSTPKQDKVWLLERDADGDGHTDGQHVLLDKLNNPHGITVYDGWLYVAEGDAVLRVRFDADTRHVNGAPDRVVRGLPSGGNHWTRTVGIGPDGLLYVSIGSSCNVCLEKDPRRAAIVRYQLDGTGEQIYASGLRNAVGFAWQPGTGALYATDNGRDLLGDDFPPCELNRVVEGGFYGWPFANGDRVPDPDYGAGKEEAIARSIPPVHGFGAHTAPLGMTFYTGSSFPERYHGAAFVAQHGSWNRSVKSGYQVVALLFRPDGSIREEPFAVGFEIDEKVYGRPVDVAVGPDGSLYVSDDFTGSIYRIAYGQAVPERMRAGPEPTPRRTGDPLAGLAGDARHAARDHGHSLWEANGCGACHLPRPGAETYRPLAHLTDRYSIDSLAKFLRTPQPPMPVFPLSDAERRDLAIFLLGEYP